VVSRAWAGEMVGLQLAASVGDALSQAPRYVVLVARASRESGVLVSCGGPSTKPKCHGAMSQERDDTSHRGGES
jgi:hypothetical protein